MAMLPKKNPTVPITSRKKAVPGVKPVEPPIPTKEEIILPKVENTTKPKVVPKAKTVPKPTVPKSVPKPQVIIDDPLKPLAAEEEKVLELINRRQRQVIVHSVIYYRMNNNLIKDTTWNAWARELRDTMGAYPDVAKRSVFYEDMKNFDPATGFELADHPWGMKVAPSLINIHESYERGGRYSDS